uniref:PWWP domain-containing protein n=1 Tax=Chenopodium quinoa TaxID=63459 RepID=A0A803MEI6_CHEQI
MGKGGLAKGKGHDGRGKDGVLDKQSCAEFRPGDVTWIKLRGTSWWPAQDYTPKKPDGSARRLKVMQDLGLTAPSGSPFLKNGHVLSVVKYHFVTIVEIVDLLEILDLFLIFHASGKQFLPIWSCPSH